METLQKAPHTCLEWSKLYLQCCIMFHLVILGGYNNIKGMGEYEAIFHADLVILKATSTTFKACIMHEVWLVVQNFL